MNTLHQPVKRIVPGATCAVLFIHGIVATPRFFDDLAAAVPVNWSLQNLLLPGHGGSVLEFGRTPASAWTAHVRRAVEALRADHERVFIVGHSLGALLAIREAVRDNRRMAGMLLLCVPLRIWVKPASMGEKVLKGLGLGKAGADVHTYYGVAQDWRVWRYIGWIPRYLELFRESAAARREVVRMRVPAIALMARQDELVSLRSARELAGNPDIQVRELPSSKHYLYAAQDQAAILAALRELCGF